MSFRQLAIGLLLSASLAFHTPAHAVEGLIVKPSAHSVSETLDRLEAVLGEKGITVLARIDHSANAEGAGLDLPPTELLIFGNPKLGTPLMQSERTVAIDLPMKALVFEDEAGDVFLAYNAPAYIALRHGIEDRTEVIATMTGALDALTDAALAE